MLRQSFNKICRKTKFQRFTCYFSNYSQKNPAMKYDDEFRTTINHEGKLLPNSDHSFIADHDDKYGLQHIRDPAKILTHLKSVEFKYSFNDLIYFLRHLVHISEEHGIRSQIMNNYNFKEFLNHIKKCLITNQHDKFPLIGSYAYCLNKLDINDREMWRLLEYKILEDQYHTTFDESVFAAQGFCKLPLMYYGQSEETIQNKIDKVYKKLERVIRITIWEVNPIHYHSIAMALAKVNRFDPEMFAKLEQHILTNLSLNYTTKMMVDILFCFAKGKQGSLEFYDSMQYVIFKGHMFNRNFFLQSLSELSYDGHLVAKLLGIYKEAQDKYHEFQLHPDFQNKVHNLMVNRLTYYDLESLVTTMTLLPTFIKDDFKNIQNNLINRVTQIPGQFQIQDIIKFYEFIEQNYDDIKNAPIQQMHFVEDNLYKYSDSVSMDDLIIILQYLYERPKFILQPDKFINQVIKTFDQNINLMTAAQIDMLTSLFQPFLEFQQKQIGDSLNIKNTLKKLKDIQLIKQYYQKQIE
ncbi:unnamed protein product [Paramecium pentaurelia]|uniref:Uncharacterized protein n=1 Tax=Paramecium pentaurelia TaxID=43138 RepID=A0A8S1W8I1_9CILI|nr:unnamed protein product [Paramecium pentaurelia]